MNFVFISPQFPALYWRFCAALSRDGACVLGIGDTPYDQLLPELKGALTEYYWVSDLANYDQVFRAVAFFSFKYGKIDWIESNNEYWLAQDARLREDFNVLSGPRPATVKSWQSKAAQKQFYAAAGVPTARQTHLTNFDETRWFIGEMGHFPVFAKPEFGVGSAGTQILRSNDDLNQLLADHGEVSYVIEQLVEGDICSYDAIVDALGEPLFENQEEFPPSMADVVAQRLDLTYLSRPDVDPELARLGRAAIKSFGITSRFVHLEFFRLAHDHPGLGAQGSYVGLEVNVRPPGGNTPEMMCWAHDVDVFQIWADMICFNERRVPQSEKNAWCVYAGRRDIHHYVHAHEEICSRFGDALVSQGRVPDALSNDLGNYYYMARLATPERVDRFVSLVQEKVPVSVEPESSKVSENSNKKESNSAD